MKPFHTKASGGQRWPLDGPLSNLPEGPPEHSRRRARSPREVTLYPGAPPFSRHNPLDGDARQRGLASPAHWKLSAGCDDSSVAELHDPRRAVYPNEVNSQRLNITLDEAHAAKLSRLAARVHVNEGTLARSLLSTAIDDADPDAANVVAVLDGIEWAWERAQLGSLQAGTGETIPLDDL